MRRLLELLGRMSRSARASARIVCVGRGDADGCASSPHRLVVHLDEPVRSVCRVGNLRQRRLQRRGDVDVVPSGYCGKWRSERPARLLLVRCRPDSVPVRLAPRLGIQHADLGPVIDGIERELSTESPDWFRVEGLAAAFAARVAAWFPAGGVRVTSPLTARRIGAVRNYVLAHLSGDVRLEVLATQAGLRTSQFTAAFRAATGFSPYEFVTRCRVERARDLIREGNMTLAEVALASGFSHQSHMTRRLREVLGVTPGSLRASCAG